MYCYKDENQVSVPKNTVTAATALLPQQQHCYYCNSTVTIATVSCYFCNSTVNIAKVLLLLQEYCYFCNSTVTIAIAIV